VKSLKFFASLVLFCTMLACTVIQVPPFGADAPMPTRTAAMPPVSLPVTATAEDAPTATDTPDPTPTPPSFPWTNELETMYGICFEAALDAAGQVVVLRSAEAHIRYYNLADSSGLCRQPVARAPFDFQDGERVLAGTWSVGTGCTAEHEIVDYTLSDGVLQVTARFVTAGDCNYELVRPFWIGVAGVNDVQITIIDEGESAG
jgi:hypothetical protein